MYNIDLSNPKSLSFYLIFLNPNVFVIRRFECLISNLGYIRRLIFWCLQSPCFVFKFGFGELQTDRPSSGAFLNLGVKISHFTSGFWTKI